VRQELIRQFVIAFVEIRVVGFEVVANIEDVLTAEVLRLEEVGVFDQRKERIASLLGDVVPVVPLRRKGMLDGDCHHHCPHALQIQ